LPPADLPGAVLSCLYPSCGRSDSAALSPVPASVCDLSIPNYSRRVAWEWRPWI